MPQKPGQALHGGLQDLASGRVADADGPFAPRAECHAGRQADPRFFQQLPAEAEGVGQTLDSGEKIEGSVRVGTVTPGMALSASRQRSRFCFRRSNMPASSASPCAKAVSAAFCAKLAAWETMNSFNCVAFCAKSRRATSQPTRQPVMQ